MEVMFFGPLRDREGVHGLPEPLEGRQGVAAYHWWGGIFVSGEEQSAVVAPDGTGARISTASPYFSCRSVQTA